LFTQQTHAVFSTSDEWYDVIFHHVHFGWDWLWREVTAEEMQKVTNIFICIYKASKINQTLRIEHVYIDKHVMQNNSEIIGKEIQKQCHTY
jgi:hypothetical protein